MRLIENANTPMSDLKTPIGEGNSLLNNKQNFTQTKSRRILQFTLQVLQFLTKIFYQTSLQSGKFALTFIKLFIKSVAPSLNLEINTTPSLEEFPKRISINTKMFLTLDWNIPLLLSLKTSLLNHSSNNNEKQQSDNRFLLMNKNNYFTHNFSDENRQLKKLTIVDN
ncbi:hypothetical protein ABK040_006729 [Willaertia magna]